MDYIKTKGPVGGKTVAEVVGVEFESFRRGVAKKGKLAAHGVRNDQTGDGYYHRSM